MGARSTGTRTRSTDASWDDVHAVRAARHMLAAVDPVDAHAGDAALTVARRTAGIQAQVDSTVGLCVAARRPRMSAAEIARQVAGPELSRVWAMRGTLHVVPTRDLHRYAAALGDSVAASQTRLWPRRGVPADSDDTVTTAIIDALAGGPLTRHELAERVGHALGPAHAELLAHPWGIGIKPAVARGLVALRGGGSSLRLSLPDPGVRAELGTVSTEDAQAWLARAYLDANVVGSRASFGDWAGINRRAAAAALDAAADGTLTVAGVSYATRGWDGSPGPDPALRLVPAFDPFTLAVQDKAGWGGGLLTPEIYRAGGWVSAVVVNGGQPVGVWKATTGRRPGADIDMFGVLDGRAAGELIRETHRVEAFLAAGR
ncbi:MAG TPA: crosslink repair DNA glycosylase YcaQ family protein [Micromonosporaceae bacterium]|nr:crosslink repair DNA glycosylase YcaQ family protein [Micromonosporaceae bacterium]